MEIQYLRSSSYNEYSMCQQQYFIDYVLGFPKTVGKKAAKGTIVHKVLECLAKIKKQIDEDDIIVFDDKEIGTITNINIEDVYKKETLPNKIVDKINSTRINKSTYKDDCKLSYGHYRKGISLVEHLIKLCYQYYAEDDWTQVDYNDCTNWVWMILDYKDGLFDPRNRKIVSMEQHFDIEIDKDWAVVTNGEKLRIKGTIDLITEAKRGILEIIDYKSGSRIDWVSKEDNKIKTYNDLCNDFQLMLYYYAANRLYPKAKQILVTIFYIRDGGPFTICFDDDTIIETENRIKTRLQEIQQCELPELHDYSQQHFKCRYLCDYYKNQSPNGNTNLCLFIHEQLKEKGMKEVVELYTNKGFDIGKYDAPGEK